MFVRIEQVILVLNVYVTFEGDLCIIDVYFHVGIVYCKSGRYSGSKQGLKRTQVRSARKYCNV